MTTWERHQGDAGDFIEPILDGTVDITSFTAVSGTVRNCETGEQQTLTGSMVSVADRRTRLALSPWLETATLGPWDVWTHVHFGGNRITWPSNRSDTIIVGQ